MTRFLKTWVWAAVFGVGLLAYSTAAKADSIPTVAYTVTGSSGDWTLDFTVTDNTDQNLYFLPATDQTATPTGWQEFGSDWNNSAEGGSSTEYNNNWINSDTGTGNVTPGNFLSGFDALVTTPIAPTSVQFFVYGCDATFGRGSPECGGSAYTGGGNFYGVHNPGFEGIATNASTVPEPRLVTMVLVMAVFGLMVGRKRVHQSSASSNSGPGHFGGDAA